MAEIPADQRQDPTFFRTHQEQYGRDGCRVPLPWIREGSSFGFGSGGAHLPQPSWFADASVEAEEGDPASTLSLYRRALALRHEMLAPERLEWVETGRDGVRLRTARAVARAGSACRAVECTGRRRYRPG